MTACRLYRLNSEIKSRQDSITRFKNEIEALEAKCSAEFLRLKKLIKENKAQEIEGSGYRHEFGCTWDCIIEGNVYRVEELIEEINDIEFVRPVFAGGAKC